MGDISINDYCSTLKQTLNHLDFADVNPTRVISFANKEKDFLKSPWGTMIRIEFLVLIAFINLSILKCIGSLRRRNKNFIVQKGVLAAYTLSSSLISYTLGSMQSSVVKSSLYPIWAMTLYIFLGSVDSTAYSLTDHNQSTRLVYGFALDIIYAVLLSITVKSFVGAYLIYPMVLLAILRFFHRFLATKMATDSWNLNKTVADYMETEHKHADYDACKMEGYHYLVDWPLQDVKLAADGISYGAAFTEDATQVVDIEKVWKHSNDRSLIRKKLRDVCLSFSLFHLLRRRFFGFGCGESRRQKTRDFVFAGLLARDDSGAINYERVFRVIDVELAFMYDFFFTNYVVLYYRPRAARFWSLVTVSLLMFLEFYPRFTQTMRLFVSVPSDMRFLCNKPTLEMDLAITKLMILYVGVSEIFNHVFFATSIWGGVSFVCQYVREQTSNTRRCIWCVNVKYLYMKWKEILAKTGACWYSEKSFWQDKLDQYSLLESVGYSDSIVVKVLTFCTKYAVAVYGLLCVTDIAAFYPVEQCRGRWIGRKPGKPFKLTAEVKDAIVHCLDRIKDNLTNGESALLSNEAHHLLWALRTSTPVDLDLEPRSLKTENQTIIILTWHIATCYCEMAPSSGVETGLQTHLVVATALSKYCAYLVVSAPKLLPGHHFDTTVMFNGIAAEAIDFLGHAQDKYERMRCSQEAKATFFHEGLKLGKQLEEMEEWKRWKVLAEFWAEMLLYLAPSDNVKEHVESLAKGGEFITHLWALLTHAGILYRSQRNHNVPDDIARDSGTYQQDPRGLPYGAALRLRQASPYLDKCAEGAASAAALRGNRAQTVEVMVHQPANPVQSGEGAPNDASNGPSEIESIA